MLIFKIIVYSGKINENIDVAIKFELCGSNCSFLQAEYEAYTMLEATTNPDCVLHGIPYVYYYGPFIEKYIIIAMTRLDSNINDEFERCGKQFTRETLILILIQAV